MHIQHLKPPVAEARMTPMVDRTLRFVAFFMIVSSVEALQADEPVIDSPRDDIIVNVGFLPDSDEAVLLYDDRSIPVLESAPYFLRERTRQITISGEESLSNVTIAIRADKTMSTGLIQQMILIAREAGFTQFLLTVEEEPAQPNGHFDIDRPIDFAESRDEPPPQVFPVRLWANEDGSLQQVYFGHNPLGDDSPACFQRLNEQIAALIGASGVLADSIVVEIDAADNLDFHYTVKAVSACQGRIDPVTQREVHFKSTVRLKLSELPEPAGKPR